MGYICSKMLVSSFFCRRAIVIHVIMYVAGVVAQNNEHFCKLVSMRSFLVTFENMLFCLCPCSSSLHLLLSSLFPLITCEKDAEHKPNQKTNRKRLEDDAPCVCRSYTYVHLYRFRSSFWKVIDVRSMHVQGCRVCVCVFVCSRV